MLSLQGIAVRRDARTILAVERLHIACDQFTVILGHNGSGKSTLMNLMARQFTADRGHVELHNKPLEQYSARDFARHVAFLPQHFPEAPGLTVRELVLLGRYPWRGLFGRWQAEDYRLTERALQQTDIGHYAEHLADSLSGGERQRAWIAMSLAQQAPLILLDEPTSALDLAHQYELMSLLRQLNRSAGRGIVAILHDINLAARYADRIVALKQSRVFFDGSPEQLLCSELLSELYGVAIQLLDQPDHRNKIAVVN
ncbi:Iron(3+)-hydroxamate import ATP-binding protein FhuC [Pseudomonas sp. 37 R 15]|uniref:ABC transporter ATP-binding protein n=1 Tax=Pseudomonas sp. 37 R 15 TaxID=1844104 RepID=UPI000812AF79|nr:ABC transporter ATP-binding protein [Pseudomonas sp. 37 R 15]CRM39451.1 Iron(3+)-hydroxamate import ATP-binding protein FhuC [Pseudomonas sp. 37 R 15]